LAVSPPFSAVSSAGDVLGEFLDRDAGLHAPDVRLGEHELV